MAKENKRGKSLFGIMASEAQLTIMEEGMAADRHGIQNRKLRDLILNHKNKTEKMNWI